MSIRSVSLLIFIWLCFMQSMHAQVDFKQSLDSTSMFIGDQQILTQKSKSLEFQVDPLAYVDTLSWMEILEKGSWQQLPDKSYERKIRFTVFDSGQYLIPAFNIHYRNDSVVSNPLQLDVSFVPDSLQELRPIKDIIETDAPNYFPYYLIGGILVLAGMLFLLYLFFKADSISPGTIEYKIQETALQKALRNLDELNSLKLWQQGEIKIYYDRLTDIVRKYISDAFYLPALESTTEELIEKMTHSGMDYKHLQDLKIALKEIDLVKFANLHLDISKHQHHLDFMRMFMESNDSIGRMLDVQNKKTFEKILGSELASQFENPQEEVPKNLLDLIGPFGHKEFVLISGLVNKNTFSLPKQWVLLHERKVGQLFRWHKNLVDKTDQPALRVMLIVMALPFIAVFLPFLMIIAFWKNERLIQSGLFGLSKQQKLILNYKEL